MLTEMEQVGLLAPFLLLASAVVALPVTSLLLRRYRRSVARLMSARPAARPVDPSPHHHPTSTPAGSPPDRRVLRRRRAAHVAITVGAGLFVGLSYTWLFYSWTGLEVLPLRTVFLVLMFWWPAIPGVWVASDGDGRLTLVAAGVYFAVSIAVSMAAGAGIANAVAAWAFFNGPATLVVAAFFSRQFRAVGVLVLGVIVLAIVGAQALLGTLESDTGAELAVEIGTLVGIGDAVAIFVLVPLVGFTVTMAGGWLLLGLLGRWYSHRGFSDHMLLLGSMCFVFCLDYVALAAQGELGALAVGLGLFAVLAVGTLWVFHSFVRRPEPPRRLLLLRVFDQRGDKARLLDAVAARWRHLGPVRLIGAPDLAAATIEPDEFMTFTSGRLRRLFIDDAAALADRLAMIAPEPDPDGRYRIDEFFCFDTTWRQAVESLLSESDLVLMDVRGLTADRRGAIHELELLAMKEALDRTLLLVDDHTTLDLVDAIAATGDGSAPRHHRVARHQSADAVIGTLLAIGSKAGFAAGGT